MENVELTGQVAVVTGGNSGLGLATVRGLAERGARVVVAVRNVPAGLEAVRGIGGTVEVRELDLASMASVRAFTAELIDDHPKLDLLVNNAGVMLLGPRRTSADGFELQFATNALGQFALTGLLLGSFRSGRVVNVSSATHRGAHLDFADLMFERGYRANVSYARSKLAATVFGVELDRRLRAAGSPMISVLAHPGMTRTKLTPRALEQHGRAGRLVSRVALLAGQPVERGVLPQLHAATDPSVRGGDFYGPSGPGELRGPVGRARLAPQASDPSVGQRLWAAAEELTGVRYLSVRGASQ
ncbi:SDR family NAD(P)-dependent oxidoreductase [Kribbella sandramycini]|uniref:NAD(P)-dependent dehydrogenase (Short-subunit alcohol dehydrogenase family) n=1 Tax=Kribbella sandramycini TaxID=60450 RepID=A0A7Y4P037_9ACTN|nr:oxidoreductase [Kribbella sandramycini]MBB6566608.1 NAD(P)-dependent dehydrogenase (short-subunit alcohol dehydrogenase family) [Kribbella sandramycini]NOL42737.1 SDR family NAD(P)-dependent oxidoreductase [Kribbella sandramycini]